MSSAVDQAWLDAHPGALIHPPRRGVKHKGYPAAPGTGPEKETCKTCANLCRNQMAKTYLKCGLMKQFWTGGPGTDIKARSPACSLWKAKHEHPVTEKPV